LDKLIAGGTVEGVNVGRAAAEITDLDSYYKYRQNLIEKFTGAKGITDVTSQEYLDLVKLIDTALGVSGAVTGNKLGNL
jgi:hypothetical protein